LSRNLGALTSWNPLGHSRPVTGLLCLYLLYIYTHTHIHTHINVFYVCNDKCTCCAVTVPEYKYINVLNVTKFTSFSFRCGATAPSWPWPPHCRGFTTTLIHTTVGNTPPDEWSARRRDLLSDNTQHLQQTNIHASGGIRTRNPS